MTIPEVKAPKRAYQLTMDIGADSLADLIGELNHIIYQLHTGSTNVTGGGPSGGGWFTLTHDPEMTHDRYFAQVNEYLAYLDAKKKEQPHGD